MWERSPKPELSVPQPVPSRRSESVSLGPDVVLRLQGTVGNAVVARLAANVQLLPGSPKVAPRRRKRLIYIDGSVLDQVNRGNKAIAERLLELSKSATLRMTGYNYAEMTQRGSAANRKAMQLLIDDLRIGVDKRATMAQWSKRLVEAWSARKVPSIQPKDIPMVAVVPKGAELWSVDKTIRNQAKSVAEAFDIRIAEESTKFPPNAVDKPDYKRGRALLQLSEVEIDQNGRLAQLGGRVVKGKVTIHVPSGETIGGEIDGSPRSGGSGSPPPKLPSPVAAKPGKTFATYTSRLAKGAGRLGLSALMPGPEDAITLMVEYAGSYTAAQDSIRERYTRHGIAMGVAAGMIGLEWPWVQENLWRRFAERDSAVTHVIAAVGLAERSYNSGLFRGHKYGAGHSQSMKSEILAAAFDLLAAEGYSATEEELFSIEFVARTARVLTPIADDFLRQASERREARERREHEQSRQQARDWGAIGNKI